jgi:hypothetical protein
LTINAIHHFAILRGTGGLDLHATLVFKLLKKMLNTMDSMLEFESW